MINFEMALAYGFVGFIALWIWVLQRGGGFELNLRVYPKKTKTNPMRVLDSFLKNEDDEDRE